MLSEQDRSTPVKAGFWQRLETWLTGPLAPDVRQNMHKDFVTALGAGFFFAALGYLPVILRRLGASAEELALFTTFSFVGFALNGIGLVLIRRLPIILVAVACWALGRVAFITTAFSGERYYLLVVAFLFYLVNYLGLPAYNKIIQAIYPARQRGKIIALVRVGMSVTMLAVTPLAGWLLDHYGHRMLFPLATVFSLLSMLSFARIKIKPEDLSTSQRLNSKIPWRILLQDRRLLAYYGSVFVYGLGFLIPFTLYPIIQVDRLHLSYTEVGFLTISQSTAWLVGYFYWGRLVDRVGGVRMLQVAMLVSLFAMFPYVWATRGWMLLPAFIGMGLTNAGMDTGFLHGILQLSHPRMVAESTAVQFTLVGLRGMAAPFIGVWLLNSGFTQGSVILVGIAISLLGAGLVSLVFKVKAGEYTA